MKKISIILSSLFISLATLAQQPDVYSIHGHTEGIAEGDTIALCILNNGYLPKTPSATAVVKQGTFAFTDTLTGVKEAFLVTRKEGRLNYLAIFLEKGSIQSYITPDSYYSAGTENNDAYRLFLERVNPVSRQISTMNRALDRAIQQGESQDRQAQLKDSLKLLRAQRTAITQQAARENIQIYLGGHLLKQVYSSMPVAEAMQLVEAIPARWMANDAELREMAEELRQGILTAEGQKFADLSMKTPEGKPVKLSDYAGKGKIVLVDFWASWCGPCCHEIPEFAKLYAQYKAKGFEIVGVSLDKNADAWKKAIKRLGITWPQMSDLMQWNSKAVATYAIKGIPFTMLLDGKGNIIGKDLHGDELKAKLASLLD